MNSSRFEWKVGLFVVLGLALLAVLMLNFSKGITLFKSTYELHLIMPTVSGLKPKASVMMSGVPVGNVVATDLRPDGRSVDITVQILSKYPIRTNANFHIDALGSLGDQYIAITPSTNPAPFLTNNATVLGEEPFNLQEAVRSTSGLLDQARQTMKSLDQAITNVNRTILSEETLTNFGLAVSNFQAVMGDAARMARQVEDLINTNTAPINAAAGNFKVFSDKVNVMADDLGRMISTNRTDVTEAVKNFRETSASLKQMAADLEAGKGVAGSLLKDEQLRAQMDQLVKNMNTMAANFSLFSSNLNRKGIWAMLRRPTPAPSSTPSQPVSQWPGRHER